MMKGTSVLAGTPILPGAPSETPYVLVDGNPRRIELAEILDLWKYCACSDISWLPQALLRDAVTNRRENIVSLRYAVIDLDFQLAKRDFDARELLLELKTMKLPNPSMIVSTGGGFHIYWSIGKLYIGPKLHAASSEARKRHMYWCKYYERVASGLCSLLADFGADRQATSVTHLFRLPGSYSPKHDVLIEVVYRDDDAQTTLATLNASLDAQLEASENAGDSPSASAERRFTKCAYCRALDTPAIKWVLDRSFPEGRRYDATFPVIQACLYSDLSEQRTREFVRDWNASRCIPPRGEGEIESEIQACLRRHRDGNPQGIDPRKLMELQAIDGSTMDHATAYSIFWGLPRGTDFPERKRKHRHRRGNSEQALDLCIALINSGVISGQKTNKEVAERLGISDSAFAKSVKPKLLSEGFCTTDINRVPRTTTYACPARPSLFTTYETICKKDELRSEDDFVSVDEGTEHDGILLGALARLVRNHSRYYRGGSP